MSNNASWRYEVLDTERILIRRSAGGREDATSFLPWSILHNGTCQFHLFVTGMRGNDNWRDKEEKEDAIKPS
jgi:hypothetical protein